MLTIPELFGILEAHASSWASPVPDSLPILQSFLYGNRSFNYSNFISLHPGHYILEEMIGQVDKDWQDGLNAYQIEDDRLQELGLSINAKQAFVSVRSRAYDLSEISNKLDDDNIFPRFKRDERSPRWSSYMIPFSEFRENLSLPIPQLNLKSMSFIIDGERERLSYLSG